MKKSKLVPKQNWRPTPEDWKLWKELEAKLGVSGADILRLGLRTLAAKEGVGQ